MVVLEIVLIVLAAYVGASLVISFGLHLLEREIGFLNWLGTTSLFLGVVTLSAGIILGAVLGIIYLLEE